jgi:hypothetical protein
VKVKVDARGVQLAEQRNKVLERSAETVHEKTGRFHAVDKWGAVVTEGPTWGMRSKRCAWSDAGSKAIGLSCRLAFDRNAVSSSGVSD